MRIVEKITDGYFKKPFTLGTWLMFPIKGSVRGPGGKFRARQLAKKYLKRTAMTRAMRRHRPATEGYIVSDDISQLCVSCVKKYRG
jgi:hypothetical protein